MTNTENSEKERYAEFLELTRKFYESAIVEEDSALVNVPDQRGVFLALKYGEENWGVTARFENGAVKNFNLNTLYGSKDLPESTRVACSLAFVVASVNIMAKYGNSSVENIDENIEANANEIIADILAPENNG